MLRPSLLLFSHLVFSFVVAQLPLPSPPFLPPDALFGSTPSNSPQIPNPHWSTLLGNLLYFFEAQRSGKLPSSNRVQWRNDSVLDDGKDVGLDLSAGYFDAGDYVKCTLPLSFTLMSVCWGALDYGEGYDKANQTAYLDAMLRWGLDWIINAHPHPRTLIVQVGDSEIDTSYWGGDQGIPRPRPSLQINDTSPGTDAAAQTAAALAACSLLYDGQHLNATASPASLRNQTYAQLLLSHAEQLYDFAVNASGGKTVYQTSAPDTANTYPSSGYGDELTIAALFLSYATANATARNLTLTTNNAPPEQLYAQAETSWSQYSLGDLDADAGFNWDNKSPAMPVLFTQIAQIQPGFTQNVSAWQNVAENYFDRIVRNKGTATMTKGGLLWYKDVSEPASLNPALNAAMLMLRYAPMASDPAKTAAYQAFAKTQLDYALGNNPMAVPYVVGSNPNSPSNAHSAMAAGGSGVGNIDVDPVQEVHILYGGVVGGPDRLDNYYDIRSDWPQTEIALDYVAPMLTLAAYNALNNPEDPFYTSLKPGEYEKRRPNGHPCDDVFPCVAHLPKWAKIVIGVVIGVVGLVLLISGAYWVWLRHSRKKQI